MKNVVELRTSDVSRSSGVFTMGLRREFWCKDFGSGLPGVVFPAVSFPLDEVLESSPVPMTVKYFLHLSLRFSVDDYGWWVVLRRCESFCEGCMVQISDASRKTLSPGLNTGAGVLRQS